MRYTYVSDSCVKISGYSQSEYLQMSIYDILRPPVSSDVFFDNINKEIERYKRGECDTIEASFELQRHNKNGSLNWVDVSVHVTVDSSGNPLEIIGTTRVIDDRKRLENLLRDSEYRYRYITENSRDMV
jgi:PAS domain S-box-containing protein